MFVHKTISSVGNSVQDCGERLVDWAGMRLALQEFLATMPSETALSFLALLDLPAVSDVALLAPLFVALCLGFAIDTIEFDINGA